MQAALITFLIALWARAGLELYAVLSNAKVHRSTDSLTHSFAWLVTSVISVP